MNPRNFISYIILVCFLSSCQSAKLTDAEERLRIGEYFEAATMYRDVYAKTPPKERDLRGYIAFRMAECNRLTNNTPRALNAYMNALRYNYPDSIVYLRLGQMHHKDGKYGEAIKYYHEYLTYKPNDLLAGNGIKGCELATGWKKNPTRYIVKRMDKLNSLRSTFAPMLYGEKYNQLYFTSSGNKNEKAKPSTITGLSNNNLYRIKQDQWGQWTTPKEIEDAVNTAFDEGTPSFTRNGNMMYYTYCAQSPDGISLPAEIRVSIRSNAQWKAGNSVSIVKDSVASLGHPAVSPDGKYLYYVSDATDGYGGKDIFRVCRIGNGFGAIENLGSEINTPGDEMFPYVRDSVTLYFASNGHPGMGGLDLFKATQDSSGQWHVENMQSPINSTGDDFGITFAGNTEWGFFSSNRNDARGYDHIYSFEYPTITIQIEGIVSNVDGFPIKEAAVRIVGNDGSNKKVLTKPDGTFRAELARDVNYVMMASAHGFLNQNLELQTDSEEKDENYIVDFFLSPINKPIVIENIFYDYDKATLRPESKEALGELIKLLNDNQNIMIELGAHTDCKGSTEYNDGLSQRRAQSVVDYLISKGIEKGRLKAKGYGKSAPKTISKQTESKAGIFKEGDILTEEYIRTLLPEQQDIANQINRRTEFKVLRIDYGLY